MSNRGPRIGGGGRAAIAWLVLAALAGVAGAHGGVVTELRAPVPLPLVYAGGGATVVATAVCLGRTPSGVAVEPRTVAEFPSGAVSVVATGARAVFLLAVGWAIVAGLIGPQVRAENFATVFVWPVWMHGLAIVAALIGSPWRTLSPWWTLYDGLCRIEGEEVRLLYDYPERLGDWPALVGFLLLVGVVENVTVIPRSPRLTAAIVAIYGAIMVSGAVAFGPAWLERTDPLGVLYRLFGRIAPLRIAGANSNAPTLVVRPPWRGCTDVLGDRSLAAFVVAAVYTITFDGLRETAVYQSLLFATDLPPVVGGIVLYLAGYLAFLAGFGLIAWAAERTGGRSSVGTAIRSFAPTVLPIAVAYDVAHNYAFVVANLGRLTTVVGDYWLASAPVIEPLAWLPLRAFWVTQVVLVVVGHLVAVVAAHAVAVDRYSSRRAAAYAHAPVTALMVGYTVLSLWVVSLPFA